MKVLLLQQPKSFSNYPKWIEEIQERFDCLEVMVFTSNDRAAHHSWPSSVIKEIEVPIIPLIALPQNSLILSGNLNQIG